MRRKAGEEPIYARRSFGNALPVSPADYDTSPHFGSSTPRYTIKKKYISRIEIDEKDFPDHLEPNNMPKSPSYTIRPRYHESSTSGIGYNYMPNKFGSDGLKKTIGHRIEQPPAVSYSSPDRYNTREKFGQATARYTIGRRLDEDKYNGNSSWVGLRGVDSPGPLYDSSIQPETFFARSPRFTIGEKPTDKKINPRVSNSQRKLPSEYYDPPRDMQMGNGSPRTKIHERTDEISSWMTKGKDQVPGPASYKTENSKGIFFTRQIEIKKKFPEKKIQNPSSEYLLLPELPRGRQCSIGNKETMDLVY